MHLPHRYIHVLDGLLAHSEVVTQVGICGPSREMAQESQLETTWMAFLKWVSFSVSGA